MAMFLLAIFIGCVAGLRPMTALSVTSLAASAGWLRLDGTSVVFLAAPFTVFVLMILAGAETVCDLLTHGGSRERPLSFGLRLVGGGLCGAAVGGSDGALWGGVVGGLLGASCGTLAGSDFRAWLARRLGQDSPAALTENAVAIAGATLVMAGLA